MVKRRRGFNARIGEELARLRERPREGEAGTNELLESDWCALARTALTLSDGDEALEKLFVAAGLNPRNPSHWKFLVHVLARAFDLGKRGRPRRWGPEELCQLLNDFDRVHAKYAKESDIRICERLVNSHERYANVSAQTLRRKFQDALKRNPLIENVLKGRDESDWLRRRKKGGWRLKGSVSVRELMRFEILETIMTGWRKLGRK
jgi:hypothetical protein